MMGLMALTVGVLLLHTSALLSRHSRHPGVNRRETVFKRFAAGEGDLIIFLDPLSSKRLIGVIEDGLVYPLKPYGEEFDASGLDEWWPSLASNQHDKQDIEMLHCHEGEPLQLSSSGLEVLKVLDDVSFTQRICEDRIENPHSEHAEDAYIVSARELILDDINNGCGSINKVGHIGLNN